MFITFLSTSGHAQIFKSSNSKSENPTAQKQSTKTQEPAKEPATPKSLKPSSPKVKKANAPKNKPAVSNKSLSAEASTEENAPEKAPEEDEKSVSSIEASQDCANLQDCIDAIKETLAEMKTAAELEKLNALTRKAENLLAAQGHGTAGGDTQPESQSTDKKPAVAAAADGAAPSSDTMTPTTQASDNFVSRQEYDKVLERLSRLESDYKAVSEKADFAEKSIQKTESKSGFKIFGPKESFLTLGLLMQTRMETAQDKAPQGDNWSFGLYLRRLRLMFGGELTKWLNFFVETEQANFGLNGDWGTRMFIQDAFVEFNLHPAIQIDAGMMLPPLSHHAIQGATSLLGMDYHANLVRYPSGSNLVWRDMGVMLKGLTAKEHLEYRLAIWSGVHGSATDPRNPDDLPRFTARITANVFEPEGGPGVAGMFYDGLYIKKDGRHIVSTKRVLSFGASLDWQPDLNVEIAEPDPAAASGTPPSPIRRTDYVAAAGDVFWDIPFGPSNIMSANGQVDFYYYNHGDRRSDTGFWYYNFNTPANSQNFTGWGMFLEFGIRYSQIEPLFSFDIYDSTRSDSVNPGWNGDLGDYLNFSGGLNYYLSAHATTLKFLAGADQINGEDWKAALKLQLQLLF